MKFFVFQRIAILGVLLFILCGNTLAETATVSIKTQEITRPDVAANPAGDWLVVTSLGHLFRIPLSGGEATQLTFGPWFDSEPAISPNGRYIVFTSDRDGESNGSLFVLDFENGNMRRLTSGEWASRPVWSPDGKKIVYLSYERQGLWAEYEFIARDGLLSNVKQISLDGGDPVALTEFPGLIRSAFYMPDGRIGWTELGRAEAQSRTRESDVQGKPGTVISKIMVVDTAGTLSTLLTVDGVLDRVVPYGDDFFVRHYGIPASGFLVPQKETLAVISPTGVVRNIAPLKNPQPRPGFAVVDGQIYLGEQGKLLRINAENGKRISLPFKATIEMEVLGRASPILYNPEVQPKAKRTSVLDPRLSPDGRDLFFTADGFIWRQVIGSGHAQRINTDQGFQWGPPAISPDGRQIAYQHSEGNLQHLKLLNINNGSKKTLATADRTGRFEPSWSPDGTKIVYVRFHGAVPSLYVADITTGKTKKLIDSFPRWMPRPQFSEDGQSVYYTDRNQIRQISVAGGSEPKPVTDFSNVHIGDGTISPNGQWLAYRKNDEIWVVRLDGSTVNEDSAKMLSDDGGWNFSFSPDSRSLVYAIGQTVWSHPLGEDGRTEIPVNLINPDNTPTPMLLRNLKVLDFKAGEFTDNVSMLVDNRRIQWVGSEAGKTIPDGVRILDVGGRYVIPGLFDSHTHVATPIHFNPARDVSRMSSFLAFGITSVRDLGSDITLVKSWEDRRRNYAAPVPRRF
ncbi:MAG: hypothetical protein ACR2O3_00005, partial [Rhizobiaceae bacterium]